MIKKGPKDIIPSALDETLDDELDDELTTEHAASESSIRDEPAPPAPKT